MAACDDENEKTFDEDMCAVCHMMKDEMEGDDDRKLLFKMPGDEDPCPMCAVCEEEETMEACGGCMECVAA